MRPKRMTIAGGAGAIPNRFGSSLASRASLGACSPYHARNAFVIVGIPTAVPNVPTQHRYYRGVLPARRILDRLGQLRLHSGTARQGVC